MCKLIVSIFTLLQKYLTFNMFLSIWPMIRLNLKYRRVANITKNSLRILFFEILKSFCHHICKPIVEYSITYDLIPKEEICFTKILIGINLKSYSSSSRYRIVTTNFS